MDHYEQHVGPRYHHWLAWTAYSSSSAECEKLRLDEAAARMTALAGGEAKALTCRDVQLPSMG